MNAQRVILGLILLPLIVRTGHAAPVTIQVVYSPPTLDTLTCSPGLPASSCKPSFFGANGSTSPTLIFDLDNSQRAVNGSYDVASSLSGTIWDNYQTVAASPGTSAFTATAIVRGGLVSGLNFGYSISEQGALVKFSCTGNSGAYSGVTSVTVTLPGSVGTVEIAYHGTYDIMQPDAEPGTPLTDRRPALLKSTLTPSKGPWHTFVHITGDRMGDAASVRTVWYPNDDDSQRPLGSMSTTLRSANPNTGAEIEIPEGAGGTQGGVVRIMITLKGEKEPVFAGRFTVDNGAKAIERPKTVGNVVRRK